MSFVYDNKEEVLKCEDDYIFFKKPKETDKIKRVKLKVLNYEITCFVNNLGEIAILDSLGDDSRIFFFIMQKN